MSVKSIFHSAEKNPSVGNIDRDYVEQHIEDNEVLYVEEPFCMKAADVSGNNMANDLMILISEALDKWVELYELDNIPKRMVFQQALSIMNSLNNVYEDSNRE